MGWNRDFVLLEGNAPFNANGTAVREIDAVAITFGVEAHSVAITRTHVKLCAQRVVYLHPAAPNWHLLEVWFL